MVRLMVGPPKWRRRAGATLSVRSYVSSENEPLYPGETCGDSNIGRESGSTRRKSARQKPDEGEDDAIEPQVLEASGGGGLRNEACRGRR